MRGRRRPVAQPSPRSQIPDVLASCALTDALAANRSAAVELLDDRQALDRVVKNIGKKDKRVYRAARQKLKEIVEREALPERIRTKCEELCEKLERLGRFGHWVQDRAMLDLLDRQWAEIEPEADQGRKARYQELRGRFLSAYEAYRSEHEAQISRGGGPRRLARGAPDPCSRSCSPSPPWATRQRLRQGLEQIALRWEGLEPLPEKEQASLERKFAALREEAEPSVWKS